MNRAEQRRIIVLNHLQSGALVNAEASQLLGISKRTAAPAEGPTRRQERPALFMAMVLLHVAGELVEQLGTVMK
jgi:predicted amidohydrolase YtcJ